MTLAPLCPQVLQWAAIGACDFAGFHYRNKFLFFDILIRFFYEVLEMWPDQVGRRIKMRQLEVLFAVVECGTMGKAAERLALSQPVISKAIADLEQTVGARLLDRGPHGAEPTQYGRALLKRSIAIFDELRQSVGEIKFLADPTAGELRVACSDSMLSGLLPQIINRLCVHHPRLTLHVSQGRSGAPLYHKLRDRNVDLVLAKVPKQLVEADLKAEIL